MMQHPFVTHSGERVPDEDIPIEIFVDPKLKKVVTEGEERRLRTSVREFLNIEYQVPFIGRILGFYKEILRKMATIEGPIRVVRDVYIAEISILVKNKTVRLGEFETYLGTLPDRANIQYSIESIERDGRTKNAALAQMHHNMVAQERIHESDFCDIEEQLITQDDGMHISNPLLILEKYYADFIGLCKKNNGVIPHEKAKRMGILSSMSAEAEITKHLAYTVPEKTKEIALKFLADMENEWDISGNCVGWMGDVDYEDAKSRSIDRFRKARVYRLNLYEAETVASKIINGAMIDLGCNILKVGQGEYIVRFERSKKGHTGKMGFAHTFIPDAEVEKFKARFAGGWDFTGYDFYRINDSDEYDSRLQSVLGGRYAKRYLPLVNSFRKK